MPFKKTIPMTCPTCAKSFLAARPAAGRPATKFCSGPCAKESLVVPLDVKFSRHAPVGAADECWEWTGTRAPFGYGVIGHRGTLLYGHRVAWERANGPIPPKTEVCHSCDNAPCVNPAHLFLGTHADNMADMAEKQRVRVPGYRGERHPGAVLTDEKVRMIRTLLPTHSQAAIARTFGVSRPTVTAIATGRLWRHLT